MNDPNAEGLPFEGSELERLLDHADQAFFRNLDLLGHADEVFLQQDWDARAYLAKWPFRGVSRPVEFDFAVILVQVFMPHYIFARMSEVSSRARLH